MNKNYPETHRSKGNAGKLRGDIQCLGKSAIYALEEIRRQQLNVREHLPISVWESSEFEEVEKLSIRLASPEVHVCDLEVTPNYVCDGKVRRHKWLLERAFKKQDHTVTHVVSLSAIVTEKFHRIIVGDVLRIFDHEL
ncbi:hypothetical protein HHX47_DHR4001054 [Lentinula edodes]|nr:hypothetical protein HHX47_DHR4001054 [Lentinula edodes]